MDYDFTVTINEEDEQFAGLDGRVRTETSAASAEECMTSWIATGQVGVDQLPLDVVVRGGPKGVRRFRFEQPPTYVVEELRTCRVCGCTDDRACDPPCAWIEGDDERWHGERPVPVHPLRRRRGRMMADAPNTEHPTMTALIATLMGESLITRDACQVLADDLALVIQLGETLDARLALIAALDKFHRAGTRQAVAMMAIGNRLIIDGPESVTRREAN